MSYKDKALEYHAMGYNCAQAVACAFEDEYDIDHKTLFRLCEAYGFGMGNMEGTCGALSGALLLVGYLNSGANIYDEGPKTKADTYKIAKEIMSDFKNETGAVLCKELKTPKSPTFTPCNRCISLACDLLENKLESLKK